jgi:hypothetical protein
LITKTLSSVLRKQVKSMITEADLNIKTFAFNLHENFQSKKNLFIFLMVLLFKLSADFPSTT